MKYGLINKKPDKKDWLLGTISSEKEFTDGHWDNYLPKIEHQNSNGFDTMACFPANTKVLMSDLIEKKISDIKIGDNVISHKGKIREVIDTFQRNYKDKLIRIKVIGLYEPIVCTKEHPILTTNGWEIASNLTNKSKVLIPLVNNKKLQKHIQHNLLTNKDFLWLLGFYLAEGSLGNNKSNRTMITFSISQKETEYANKIIGICKELFNTDFHIYKKKNSFAMSVVGGNIELRNLLNKFCGQYSGEKKLISHIMFLRPSLQKEILKGWLDGDGCYQIEKRKITGVSISEILIKQMYRILLRNKIKGVLFKRKAYGIHKTAYQLDVSGTEINKLYKWNLLERGIKQFRRDFYRSNNNNFLKRKISSIKEIDNDNIKVYNLEVKDDNSYIVESVAVHNCVIYSALNCLETLHNRLYGVEVNWSDRFTAKTSGTSIQGNTLHNVAECIRKFYGTVKETDYPSDGDNWNEYYKTITDDLYSLGKEFYNTYQVNYEWVETREPFELIDILKVAPLQVTIRLIGVDDSGYYVKTDKTPNHAVMLYGYKLNDYWLIFDHYTQHIKKLAWDFKFGAIMKYKLSKLKSMKFIKSEDKPDVYLVKADDIIAISGEEDFFNLENNWNAVETITQQELDNYNLIEGKKLYCFIR